MLVIASEGIAASEAAVDLALLVEREPLSSTLALQSTKTRGTDALPFGAQFAFEHGPGTTELAMSRFFGVALELLEMEAIPGTRSVSSNLLQ